jgi:hypothetical protein
VLLVCSLQYCKLGPATLNPVVAATLKLRMEHESAWHRMSQGCTPESNPHSRETPYSCTWLRGRSHCNTLAWSRQLRVMFHPIAKEDVLFAEAVLGSISCSFPFRVDRGSFLGLPQPIAPKTSPVAVSCVVIRVACARQREQSSHEPPHHDVGVISRRSAGALE